MNDRRENLLVKKCNDCGELKSFIEMTKDKRNKNGMASQCYVCKRKSDKKYTATHKRERSEYWKKYYEGHKREKREYGIQRRKRSWAINSIGKHRRKGIDVQVTIDELEKLANEIIICPKCGCGLDWTYGTGRNLNSPTWDRIYNERIMTKENTRIICHNCNTGKSTQTDEEHVEHCRAIVKIADEKRSSSVGSCR